MSRSVTVAVAYIMSATNLPWKDALKVVRAGRAVANPNLGFQKQLQDFEDTKLIEVSPFYYSNKIISSIFPNSQELFRRKEQKHSTR